MDEVLRLGKYCIENKITIDDLKNLVLENKRKKEEEFKVSISRMKSLSQRKVRTGKIYIDCHDHIIVNQNGHVLNKKKPEVLICEFAVANHPEILSISQIRSMLKTFGFNAGPRPVVVYISRINKVLPNDLYGKYLKTVYKRGYVWNYQVKEVQNK